MRLTNTNTAGLLRGTSEKLHLTCNYGRIKPLPDIWVATPGACESQQSRSKVCQPASS